MFLTFTVVFAAVTQLHFCNSVTSDLESLKKKQYTERIQLSGRRLQQQIEDQCVDIQPPEGSPFTCEQFVDLDICSILEEEFCQRSCGKCCFDVPLPGASDCSGFDDSNLCNADGIRGVYCNATCGVCKIQSSGSELVSSPVVALTPVIQPTIAPSQGGCSDVDALQCDLNALLSFKSTIIRGEDVFESWTGNNPCTWQFVACEKVDGVNSRVVELDIDVFQTPNEFAISAEVTPQMSDLRYLEKFTVQATNISAQLFPEFSVLTNLKEFEFNRIELTGTIPKEYSTWNLLQSFAVVFNTLTGTIPPELSEWKNLQFLFAQNNLISGSLPPELSTLTTLFSYSMSLNKLTGKLPVEYSNLKNMFNFDVFINSLSGSLPPEYSTMTFIDLMDFDFNSLTGSLPPEYSKFQNIMTFLCVGNKLTGELPRQYSELEALVQVDFGYNSLSGSLPIEYSTLTNLQTLNLEGNLFFEDAPDEWSTFSNFAAITL